VTEQYHKKQLEVKQLGESIHLELPPIPS